MKIKQELINELDKIVSHTSEQTIFRRRSNEYLYVGLAWVYLWWVRANKIDRFFKKINKSADTLLGKFRDTYYVPFLKFSLHNKFL